MGCCCTTFTTEEGRHRLKDLLENESIHAAAAPFGLSTQLPVPKRMLVRDRKKQHPLATCRLNKNLHAKLLITPRFVIHGSCNFTTNSIQNEQEIISTTYRDCCPDTYQTFTAFFEASGTAAKHSTASIPRWCHNELRCS